MAKHYDANKSPTTGTEAIFTLKTVLKAAGWTVPSSSDGTTYNASGDQITHIGSGAGGLANTGAWFRIRQPDGAREFTFQRGTTGISWRLKYSAFDLFTGGTPGATQTPSATDEIVLRGGGTDASPTYVQVLPTDGTYKWHVVAQDAKLGTALGAGYGFWAWAQLHGSAYVRSVMMLEPLLPGSYPEADSRSAPTTGDADPVFMLFQYQTSELIMTTSDTAGGWCSGTAASIPPVGWYKYNMAGETWVNFPGHKYVDNLTSNYFGLPRRQGPNPYTQGYDLVPVYMGRGNNRTTQIGMKGLTGYLRLIPTWTDGFPTTTNFDTDAMVMCGTTGSFFVPWPENVRPLM